MKNKPNKKSRVGKKQYKKKKKKKRKPRTVQGKEQTKEALLTPSEEKKNPHIVKIQLRKLREPRRAFMTFIILASTHIVFTVTSNH